MIRTTRFALPIEIRLAIVAAVLGSCFLLSSSPSMGNPWAPMTSAVPGPSILVPSAKEVPGKDFSDVRDRDAAGFLDPEQVVAWDGLGGVRDSYDYSGSRAAFPEVAQDQAVDGLAAGGDALFQSVIDNQAALLFSVETDPDIYFERATGFPAAPAGFGLWASALDIDAMNPPLDTDALEVWGGDNNDDSDRYSIAGDPFIMIPGGAAKVAVWQYALPGGPSAPHTFTTDLAAAMDLQYVGVGLGGPLWGQLVELMDVDAIMMFGPRVLFSIRPLDLTPAAPFFFDGGEIWEYNGAGVPTEFLDHGGHLWSTAFDVRATFGLNHENIDAIEAVAQFVPEPSALLLGMLAMALLIQPRRG
jgi:hypothetical protein